MPESRSVALLHAKYARLADRPIALLTDDDRRSFAYYQAELAAGPTLADQEPAPTQILAWVQGVKMLETFCAREGRMPRENRRLAAGVISEEERVLANRIRGLRRSYDAGRLCRYQVERLECIPGFVWHPLEDQWHAAFLEYRNFTELNMDVPKIRSGKPAERRLAAWAAKNRLAYRVGSLSPKRVSRLNGLSFWTWGESIPSRRGPAQAIQPDPPQTSRTNPGPGSKR